MKILIIDNDETALEILSHVLRRAGYQVFTSQKASCLDLILKEQPDLVLLDVNMPGIDGETAARTLTRDRQAIKGKIVFHSANEAGILEGMAKAAGLDGYICKTNRVSDLVDRVRSILDPGTDRPAPKVLLVHGDAKLLAFMTSGLEPLGIKVVSTTSSLCTNLVLLEKPDLVVLGSDVQGMAGDLLASIIRSLPGATKTRLALLIPQTNDRFSRLLAEGRVDSLITLGGDWTATVTQLLAEVERGPASP
jgi:CheY-like chemotaxis protein